MGKKIRTMPTDPARVRRTDVGDPDKCPVWQLHQVYSNDDDEGMGAAGLPQCGHRLHRMQAAGDRRRCWKNRSRCASARSCIWTIPTLVRNIIADGCEKARKLATETMRDVREAMGLEYH